LAAFRLRSNQHILEGRKRSIGRTENAERTAKAVAAGGATAHLRGCRALSFLIWRSRTSILRCFVFSDTLCLLLGIGASTTVGFSISESDQKLTEI
jgi:hypothetical protein